MPLQSLKIVGKHTLLSLIFWRLQRLSPLMWLPEGPKVTRELITFLCSLWRFWKIMWELTILFGGCRGCMKNVVCSHGLQTLWKLREDSALTQPLEPPKIVWECSCMVLQCFRGPSRAGSSHATFRRSKDYVLTWLCACQQKWHSILLVSCVP